MISFAGQNRRDFLGKRCLEFALLFVNSIIIPVIYLDIPEWCSAMSFWFIQIVHSFLLQIL